ncbi:MAG: metallophosphoesterase [Candidatus Bathyarchaeota archaeon]|nr:metallophosphoesterase [Candidatus Bathyarchaeota archaeon]
MDQPTTELRLLTPHAAFLIRKGSEKVLVVSDLHIGWEVALAEEGVHVPSQTTRLIDRLRHLVTLSKPDRLIVLGDVKHTVAKIELEEWRDVPKFFEEACKILPRVQVIPGNHDGNLEALVPESVEILPPRGTTVGDLGLFHGHTWPEVEILGCSTSVIGHVHPVVTFKDPMGFRITRQVWVRAPCDRKLIAKFVLRRHNLRLKKNVNPEDVLKTRFNLDLRAEKLLIMPSFNDFLGGQAVNRSTITRRRRFRGFIGPVLRSGSVYLEKAEAYLLDGTFLGSLDNLRRLS